MSLSVQEITRSSARSRPSLAVRQATRVLSVWRCKPVFPACYPCSDAYTGLHSSRFVMMVSAIAIIFAVVFFVVGITTVYKGKGAQTVTFAVSILVAFVPEGLPSVVTLLLSIAAKRMAAQNVLVKDLQGVETLGSVCCSRCAELPLMAHLLPSLHCSLPTRPAPSRGTK